jgi:hypothetical protein
MAFEQLTPWEEDRELVFGQSTHLAAVRVDFPSAGRDVLTRGVVVF